MTKNIGYLGILLTIGLFVFLSLSSAFFPPIPLSVAPDGATAKAPERIIDFQAGQSDGILLLGILIFVFILVPIVIRYRDLREP